MINKQQIITDARARLIADAPLLVIVGGVYQRRIPSTHDWSKIAIEIGEQTDTRDGQASGYGSPATTMLLRVMAHDRGGAPGVQSTDDIYAALMRADAVLTGTPFTSSGTFDFVRESAIPPGDVEGEDHVIQTWAGNLYRLRTAG